ncbi:hypothetical protein [Scytonema sp. PRP1]|uniref:hypothetical protein n=1 Tax=Scytonema sp. PRP1 TaxID=3120513 RepID=UPI00300D2CD9
MIDDRKPDLRTIKADCLLLAKISRLFRDKSDGTYHLILASFYIFWRRFYIIKAEADDW